MANEIVTEIRLELDKFRAALKGAEAEGRTSGQKAGKGMGDGFEDKAGAIAGHIGTIFKAAGVAAGAVGVAFAAAVKGIHIAEEIEAVGRQFDILTDKAGISGEALRTGLNSAASGLIGTTDLMKSANKALIDMGASAAQLPLLMELARKSTAIFGGELLSNFDAINQAITTTNTRGLRSLGIVLDQEKAYKDFAASVGGAASALTLAGKQQALLQATLATGDKAFQGVKTGSHELSDSYTRMKVAIGDAVDAIALSFKKFLGGDTGRVFGVIANAADAIAAKLNPAAETSAEKLARMAGAVKSLELELAHVSDPSFQGRFPNSKNLDIETTTAALSTARLAWAQFKNGLDSVSESALNVDASLDAVRKPAAVAPATKALYFDTEELRRQHDEFQKVYTAIEAARIEGDLASGASRERITLAQYEKLKQIDLASATEKTELERQFLATGVANKQEFANLEVQLESLKAQRIKAILDNQLLTTADIGQRARNAFNGFFAEMQITAGGFEKNLRGALVDGMKTLGQGFTSSFAAIGGALAKGESALDAFGKSMLGVFGDLAIQLGMFFVAQGVAMLFTPGLQAAGVGSIAAGLALAVVGGALKGLAGGGGGGTPTTSAATSSSGGGVAADSGTGLSPATDKGQDFTEQRDAAAGARIEVNVHGNILDRRQSGLEIAEIINEAFGSNGVAFSKG